MRSNHDAAEGRDLSDARRRGLRLEWLTVAWNAAEVGVTVSLGLAAHSLALIAFGMDSLIEIFTSLVVVWHLAATPSRTGRRQTVALRLVSVAFVLLAAYLVTSAVRFVLAHQRPDASPLGIAYLALTAVVMFSLARRKRQAGESMGDAPFVAEASMTTLDGWLALGTLTALAANAAFGWWWADPGAAVMIAVFALREARENWHEASETQS